MRRAALLLVTLMGCVPAEPAPPNVAAVEPSMGLDEAVTTVTVTGRNFDPRVFTDFSDRRQSEVDAAFRIFLVRRDGSGEPVPLESVTRLSAEALEARVPAGVPRGVYDVQVESPSGQMTVVPDGFQVLRAPRHVSGFRIEPLGPQRIGIPFQLAVTAIDDHGQVVDGFGGTVLAQDATGTVTPSELGPFVLGRFRGAVAIGAYAAQNVLELRTHEGITAHSAAFQVIPGFVTEAVIVSAAVPVSVGDCSAAVELETRDASGAVAAPEADLLYVPDAAPSQGVAFFADPLCQEQITTLVQPAGETRARLFFKGERAGEAVLFLLPEVLPSVAQKQLFVVGAPQALRFASLAPNLKVGACSGALTVDVVDAYANPTAPQEPVEVTFAAAPVGRVSFFGDAACQQPLATSTLASAVTFHIRGDAVGSVELHAEAPAASGIASAVQLGQVTP